MTSAYPLVWPAGFARTRSRETGAFKTTLSVALENVQTSLRLFGRDSGKPVSDVIISSNVSLGIQRPEDPGIAIWFKWEGNQLCIAVDRYASPQANLQAIHHVLEARRVELRHGTLALVRATLSGFRALPAPKTWQEILGVKIGATLAEGEAAYRELARQHHPDNGGDTKKMAELNRARDDMRKELAS